MRSRTDGAASSPARLCGDGPPCVTVPVGVPTPLAAVPAKGPAKVEGRWFRPDVVRASVGVRILSPAGEVLAQGEGVVTSDRACCADTEVTFAG